MPYIGATINGNKNIREYLKREPNKLNFNEVVLQQAEKLELVHSSFSDPGNDWNSWRIYDQTAEKIAEITLDGY